MRPVFLNLFKIRLPLSALISIKHRISGVFFFFMLPLLLYMYALLPLAKELSIFSSQTWVKCLLWLQINAFLYHFLAGMRHLFFDFGSEHSKRVIFLSSLMVLFFSSILMVWSAWLLWS